MNSHFRILICALFLLFTSCVGPMVSQETARTVGDQNIELSGGYGLMGFAFKASYGLTKDLDLGLQWEMLSIGIRAKYAIINNREGGFSLATALGTGYSFGGTHYYGDVMASYLTGRWEPYFTGRVTRVKIDAQDFRDEDTGDTMFTIDRDKFTYGLALVGTRYWFNNNCFMSAEAGATFPISSGYRVDNGFIITGAGGCHIW